MRCSRRSTTWCASALLAAVALPLAAGAATTDVRARGQAPEVERAVRAAIVRAVAGRMGAGVSVDVDDLRILGRTTGDDVTAVPETSARAGRAAVFSLVARTAASQRRTGSAVATVRLSGISLRAARPIPRGTSIRETDVVSADGDMSGVPLRTLPDLAQLLGAKTTRDVAVGEPFTDASVRTLPLVQSGEEVVVRARVGGVAAEARGLAAQDGGAGTVIQVVNPETRRMLKARVTGRGEVEVIHEAN